MRIGGEAPGGGTNLDDGIDSKRVHGAPPPRIVIGSSSNESDERRNCERLLSDGQRRSRCRTENDTRRHNASPGEAPEYDEQLAGERNDHGLGLLAGGDAVPVPLHQSAVLLVQQEPPCELDHAAPNPRIAHFGEPFFPPALTALVGRTREPRIPGDSLFIT